MIQYLITDPKYYTNSIDTFKKKLTLVLKKHEINIACFRDKKSPNFKELAKIFVQVCKEFKIKHIFINSNYNLAKELGATGVHLTSNQFEHIKEAKSLGLDIIISCHTIEELEKAKLEKIQKVTYSPIFSTPNKGIPKGVSQLKKVIYNFKELDIIALGGITSQDNVKEIKEVKAYGFASIRYFIN